MHTKFSLSSGNRPKRCSCTKQSSMSVRENNFEDHRNHVAEDPLKWKCRGIYEASAVRKVASILVKAKTI